MAEAAVCCLIARCTWCVGASAETATGRVETTHTALHGMQAAGQCAAPGVVQVQAEFRWIDERRAGLQQSIDVLDHRNPDGVAEIEFIVEMWRSLKYAVRI